MCDECFDEYVRSALLVVQQLLSETKRPKFAAADVPCSYNDSYFLAEFLVQVAIAINLNCFSVIGLTTAAIRKLIYWISLGKGVTVRLRATRSCKSVLGEETYRNVDRVAVENDSSIEEFRWEIEIVYEFVAFFCLDNIVDGGLIIHSQIVHSEAKSRLNVSPYPERTVYDPIDLDLNWLLRHLDAESFTSNFYIDRESSVCRTPRRNPDVEEALIYFQKLTKWCSDIETFLIDGNVLCDTYIEGISADSIFLPVVPLLIPRAASIQSQRWDPKAQSSSESSVAMQEMESETTVLAAEDINLLLVEHMRCLQQKCTEFRTSPSRNNSTGDEGMLLLVARHGQKLGKQLSSSLSYLEDRLMTQLTNALGHVVSSTDFSTFMSWHMQRLLQERYRPQPFCYAVRCSAQHSSEGVVSFENDSAGTGLSSPVETATSYVASSTARTMYSPISASTSITLHGDRFMHGWLSHAFSEQAAVASGTSLMCRSRRYSRYIVLIGKVATENVFLPKYGVILGSNEELSIPLSAELVPTAKEFNDAVESLSPEQQRFAKAYRSLQLEGSVFALAIILVRPQLEKALNLVGGSLTKELELTEGIMELLTTYHIPADVLAYDVSGRDGWAATAEQRLLEVREHVESVKAMVASARKEELARQQQEKAHKVVTKAPAPPEPSLRRHHDDSSYRVQAYFDGKSWRSTDPSSGSASPQDLSNSAPAVRHITRRGVPPSQSYSPRRVFQDASVRTVAESSHSSMRGRLKALASGLSLGVGSGSGEGPAAAKEIASASESINVEAELVLQSRHLSEVKVFRRNSHDLKKSMPWHSVRSPVHFSFINPNVD